jgi:uncharacterized protein involved in response to NO
LQRGRALASGVGMNFLPLAGEASVASRRARPSWLAVFGGGFRPFFLAAAALAVLAVPLWLLVLHGTASAGGGYLLPMAWHAHEMVFGFASAVVAGFLLTAVRNWTGRETATGAVLAGLVALWVLGRAALFAAGVLPRPLVALVDLAFLPAVAVVIARPIIASGNRRNYVMVGVLAVLTAANLAVHLDAAGVLPGWQLRGARAGVDVMVLLSAVIAGRVIPMFTRNATGAPVASSSALDIATVVTLALHTALDTAVPSSSAAAVTALLAAVVVVARARRWGGVAALREPLLWILHFGHAWIAIGLALRAASSLAPSIPSSAATHALTVGAIGSLTLGMMARVSLGHTGRPLVVRRITALSFVLLTGAAVVRVLGPIVTVPRVSYLDWLVVSGAAWSAAFALFLVAYVPILLRPRADGKPG